MHITPLVEAKIHAFASFQDASRCRISGSRATALRLPCRPDRLRFRFADKLELDDYPYLVEFDTQFLSDLYPAASDHVTVRNGRRLFHQVKLRHTEQIRESPQARIFWPRAPLFPTRDRRFADAETRRDFRLAEPLHGSQIPQARPKAARSRCATAIASRSCSYRVLQQHIPRRRRSCVGAAPAFPTWSFRVFARPYAVQLSSFYWNALAIVAILHIFTDT